jgi:hypothetical protein
MVDASYNSMPDLKIIEILNLIVSIASFCRHLSKKVNNVTSSHGWKKTLKSFIYFN